MASPNPEGNESKKDAAIKQTPSETKRQSSVVKTSGLGDLQRTSAEIDTANNQRCAKAQSKWDRRQFWVQVILTVFTGGAFVAATVYAHYARQQRDKMTESIGVTRDLVGTADKQLRYSERPWLGVAIPNTTQNLAHGQPMKVDTLFENSGKSPALHVFVHVVFKPYQMFVDVPLEIPFRNELLECYRPKPEWNDDLGGEIVLPGSLGMMMHLVSPIVNDDDLPQFAPATPTPTPSATVTPIASPTPSPTLPPIPQLGHVRLFFVGCGDVLTVVEI